MPIARRLRWALETSGLPFEILPHARSHNSAETAREAHVPLDRLVKPVLLEDERGYVLAIVPASCRVDLERLGEQMHRELELARESEIAALFGDCEAGALPPVGTAYRVPTVYDDRLAELADVYFEAGDHEDVVHMRAPDFLKLIEGALHGHIASRVLD